MVKITCRTCGAPMTEWKLFIEPPKYKMACRCGEGGNITSDDLNSVLAAENKFGFNDNGDFIIGCSEN